jgi:hypothetical protein
MEMLRKMEMAREMKMGMEMEMEMGKWRDGKDGDC